MTDSIEYPMDADVLIQAGHEGRTSGRMGAVGPLGSELQWNPVVADEATSLLRKAGLSVIRASADLDGPQRVQVAAYIHFDASTPPGSSGASLGYPDEGESEAARLWKALYAPHWPFRWMPDNFTENLRHYYGFRHTQAQKGQLVIELGDMTGHDQAAWLQPRLQWMGGLIAQWALQLIRNE